MNVDGTGFVAADENKARECLQKPMQIDVFDVALSDKKREFVIAANIFMH